MSYGGFSFPNGNARPTTEIEVLTSIVDKIRTNVESLDSESVCFISNTPTPSIEIQDNLFATVCIVGGSFDQSLIDGSGNLGLSESATVQVAVYSRIEVDQIERYQEGLIDPVRGLLSIKRQLLMALAGKNLDGGEFNSNPSVLLIEALFPSRAEHPHNKIYDEYESFTLNFEARFWWDMNSDSEFV